VLKKIATQTHLCEVQDMAKA